MARSQPQHYDGVYLDDEPRQFGCFEVERIVEAVGLPLAPACNADLLEEQLELVAKAHRLRLQIAAAPTQTQDHKFLRDLQRTAERILDLIPLAPLDEDERQQFAPEPEFGVLNTNGSLT